LACPGLVPWLLSRCCCCCCWEGGGEEEGGREERLALWLLVCRWGGRERGREGGKC